MPTKLEKQAKLAKQDAASKGLELSKFTRSKNEWTASVATGGSLIVTPDSYNFVGLPTATPAVRFPEPIVEPVVSIPAPVSAPVAPPAPKNTNIHAAPIAEHPSRWFRNSTAPSGVQVSALGVPMVFQGKGTH